MTEPGVFEWTTSTGHTYTRTPESLPIADWDHEAAELPIDPWADEFAEMLEALTVAGAIA